MKLSPLIIAAVIAAPHISSLGAAVIATIWTGLGIFLLLVEEREL